MEYKAHTASSQSSRFKKPDWQIAVAIALAVGFLTAIYSLQNGLGVTYDDASFALAARSFSLPDIRPQLPGYYLYVLIIRQAAHLTGDALTAMKYLNLVFAALGGAMLYFFWRKWFSRGISVLLTLLVMSNPFVWFYNSNTQIYTFDLFFSVTVVLMGLSSRTIYLLPVFFALGMGIRPSSAVLLLPVYIYLWVRQFRNGRMSVTPLVIAHLPGGVALLLWLLPMINASGGWKTYFGLYKTLYPVEPINLLQNIYRLSSYCVFIFLPFAIASPIIIRRMMEVMRNYHFSFRKILVSVKRFLRIIAFTVNEGLPKSALTHSTNFLPIETLHRVLFWWILPSIAFFLLFHYSKGYFMICAAGVLGSLILFIKPVKRAKAMLPASIVLQVLVYVLLPYRLPDVQVYQSPHVRKIGLVRVWLERTQSHYLMAQSHNRAVEHFWEIADGVVSRFREQISRVGDEGEPPRFILADPTFPLKSRLLQARYPDIAFAAINLYDDDAYIVYKGLTIREMKGLKDLFSRAIIISRRDFVLEYLHDFSLHNLQDDGTWASFSFSQEETERAVKRYLTLFER